MTHVTKTKKGRIVEADGISSFHKAYFQGARTYRVFVPDRVAQTDDDAIETAYNLVRMSDPEDKKFYGYTGCRVLESGIIR